MNLSIDAAQAALANPSQELRETLAGASDEARAALSSLAGTSSSLSTMNGDAGHSSTSSDRVQVVDEVSCERGILPERRELNDDATYANRTSNLREPREGSKIVYTKY
jgi:hypothetical protein